MVIQFRSAIDNKGQKQEIKFTSLVTVSKYHEFDVYEFREPSKNEMNRIEISSTQVNIMAGPSTIELELKKRVSIAYQVGKTNTISFDTLLHKLERKNGMIEFEYSLINETETIGRYQIQLIIKKASS